MWVVRKKGYGLKSNVWLYRKEKKMSYSLWCIENRRHELVCCICKVKCEK